MDELVKIEELLDSEESKELGQRMLKTYMDHMTLMEPEYFQPGERYKILIGATLDGKGFGICGHTFMKFKEACRFENDDLLIMMVFTSDGLTYFFWLKEILTAKQI